MSEGRLPLDAGRAAFGVNAQVYDRARPAYPDELYAILEDERLIAGRSILDVGAGTGAATMELVRRGAARVVAVEPDPRLARLLRTKTEAAAAPVEILELAFEDVALTDATFDLVVSATAFHWVDEAVGLATARRALRPGAAIALWWWVFGDAQQDDPFHEATKERLSFGVSSPSAGRRPNLPHALDVDARRAALVAAGFRDVRHELMRQLVRFDPRQLRELYSTFAQNQQLPQEEREALLDYVEETAAVQFGGEVERPFQTSLYLARRS